MTVKELKKLIKNLPDDTLVLQQDPFSEFTYDIFDIKKGFTTISHITNNNKTFYSSFNENDFKNVIEDNPEDEEEIKNKYISSLILYLDD